VLALVALSTAFETEDDVIVATDSNFDEILSTHAYALVEFYAPWCGHCKSLAPEYAKAAGLLKDSEVKLVKLDATIHSKTAERFHVQGYPTLKFFKNQDDFEYTGGRTAKDIVAWVTKKSGPPAAKLDTVDAARELVAANEVVVLGFFNSENDDEAKAFVTAAEHSELPYGISTSADVATNYGVTAPKIIVLKSFDDGRAEFEGEYDEIDIETFATANSLPSVIEFSDATAPKIFGGAIKSHLLLFANKNDEKYNDHYNVMRAVAKAHQGKLLFVVIDASIPEHQRIVEFFGLSNSDLPAVRLINIANEMAKYRPESAEISETLLSKFASDYLTGNLKQHLMSEKTPEDWDAKPVKVLTGENFESVVNQADKNVLVEFYAPWCGHCKQLAPVWEQLAEAFLPHSNIIIAKMDSTQNEVSSVSVQSFPTLKFYPAGSDKTPKDYNEARDFAHLAKFLMAETGVTVDLSNVPATDDDLAHDDHHDEL